MSIDITLSALHSRLHLKTGSLFLSSALNELHTLHRMLSFVAAITGLCYDICCNKMSHENSVTCTLICLFIILAVGFAASEESKCDPFPFGTNILHVVVAAIIGSILPNFCPCHPCTVLSVEEHIQFFYTKR